MSERWVYLIEVIGDDGDDHYYSGPVADHDRTFLVDHLLPTLQPLTAQDYLRGPARILLTAARSSYIVHGEQVYWCSEWQPGLVVLRFDPDGSLAWTAVRSPVPNFGGRDPLPGDSTDFDEDAENNLYNLIFDPWDAQFDADDRARGGFEPADGELQLAYANAIAPVNDLGDPDEDGPSDWPGEGVRLPMIEPSPNP